MAQYDVYRLPSSEEFALDCQSDLLSHLDTRFFVPLVPVDIAPIPAARLNPVFCLEGRQYSMVTQFAGSIAASDLTDRVASLAEQDLTIGNALDMLISGF